MYKFVPQDNRCKFGQIVDTELYQPVNQFETIDLTGSKLFSNDTFDFENNKFTIIHSHVRSTYDIPGILDINVTHGKHKDRFLYICKPDDKRLPYFLVPYKEPYNFDKSIKKIYITFSFVDWDSPIPRGTMRQNLGNVDIMNNYYEYILYCKSLNMSIQKFNRIARSKLENISAEQIINCISDKHNLGYISKEDEFIFTLDSSISSDHDDAISYVESENKVTIYISNVALVMDYLDLWDSFTKRISTIYLPDKRRTMLPAILNDSLLSLDAKKDKICYALEIYFDENNNIKSQNVKICKAYISKNFCHEKSDEFSNKKAYIKSMSLFNARNSKDLVSKTMIHFNRYMATFLSGDGSGLYRNIKNDPKNALSGNIRTSLPNKVFEHICRLTTNACKYSLHANIEKNSDLYLQATSPIRRLVDIVNNIAILSLSGVVRSDNMDSFYNYWTCEEQLEYINISSRSIRKIQSKCQIYEQYCYNKKHNIVSEYEGYLFDKIAKHDNKYQYMVYIPKINLTTYITILKEFDNYSVHKFNLYVFMNEEQDKKKIKLQLC